MAKQLLSLQAQTWTIIFLATMLFIPTTTWAEDALTDNFGKSWYDGNGNQITTNDITIPGNGMVELFSDAKGYLIQEEPTKFQKMDALEICWKQEIREVTISLAQYDENKQNYNDLGVLTIMQKRGYIDNLNTTLNSSQRLKLTLTNNNETEVTLTISSINIIELYGIAIGDIEATNLNASNILEGTENDRKISFDTGKSILTLDGVNLNAPISSNIDNLIIHLIGSNTIDSGSDFAPFNYIGELESPTLVFESEEEEEGELTMIGALYYDLENGNSDALLKMNHGYIVTNKFDNGIGTNFTGDWIIDSTEESYHIYRNVHYNLMVGEYRVNKANKSCISSGYPTYDNKTNTLQLTESYSGLVVKSGMQNLTLSISGRQCSLSQVVFESMDDTTTSGTLTIEKTEGDNDINTLTIINDEGAIIGFADVIVQSPLKLAIPTSSPTTWDATTTEVIFSDEDFYNLKVAGVWVSSSNKANVLGNVAADMPTVTFDETDNTLCLRQASIGGEKPYNGNAVESGLENLTVKICDFSTLLSEGKSFKALNETAKISFDVEGDGSLLYLGKEGCIDGFVQKTFNHGLCFVYDADSQGYYIRYMSPPTMSGYYNTITLEKNDSSYYRGCKIYYSIAYKNEANNVTGAEYSEPFYMDEPGTITAWLSAGEDNGVTKAVTGKLFGYPEYYVAPDEIITPEIYPAIDDNTATLLFTTEETETIAINDNSITGIDEGWAQVNVTLETENPDFKILNNYNSEKNCYETSFDINVGARLSTIFKDDNEYATYFYNNPEVGLMVPEGMKAYVVSSVSNDGEQLIYKEVSIIPSSYDLSDIPGASPAVLLQKGTAKAFFNIYQEETNDEAMTDFAPNLLKYVEPGNPITVTEDNKYYILYNDMFVKVTKGTMIGSENPEGKWACYLDLTGTNARTRGFNIGTGDGSTNINDAIVDTIEEQSNTWHDLQGRRITKPTKTGLYIVNGKKVVVNNK